MINKKNEVFTRVKEKIVAEYPNADVDSSYQPTPSTFPHVSLCMNDAFTPANLQDSSVLPKFVSMMFEAQVYSNKISGKDQECWNIMSIIVDTMAEMNFRLSILAPVLNINDASIYRLTARFEGMADSDGFYQR